MVHSTTTPSTMGTTQGTPRNAVKPTPRSVLQTRTTTTPATAITTTLSRVTPSGGATRPLDSLRRSRRIMNEPAARRAEIAGGEVVDDVARVVDRAARAVAGAGDQDDQESFQAQQPGQGDHERRQSQPRDQAALHEADERGRGEPDDDGHPPG